MHLWPNKSTVRGSSNYDLNAFKANRPKALDQEVWDQMVKDFKYNKQVVLGTLPKESKKDRPKRD